MNDARTDEPSPRGITRWWRNPALMRAAFGAPTFAEHDSAGAAEPDLADPAQREFGEYELLELIGRGGMGLVYRARQRGLAREVAIKLLSGGPWASPEFVARFEQEARHAAQLQHPGIVAIHELGESVDGVYYAMQLVRGESLAQRLQDGGRWAPRAAAALLRQVAEAAAYAHSLGVLHLDLKPGNVLIDEHGHPLIADFGLARRIEAVADNALVAGTPGYMAPEQARPGEPLTVATDVWALGTILHELLSGRPPRDGDDALAAVPADLRAICRRCLQSEPADRYASARELADDLGRFLENRAVRARPLGVPARILRWARRETRLAAMACIALLALLTGLAATSLQWRRAENSATAARAQTWSVRGNTAWGLVRSGHPFDAAPALLVNLQEREARGDAAGVELERLRLGTLRQNNVQWIDAIRAGSPGYAVALDRDGSRVAVSTGEEDVHLYDTRDGRELWRTNTLNASHMWPYRRVRRLGFTRDGRHLIAERGEPDIITRPSGQDTILIDAADGRIAQPPPQRFADFRDATYSDDGRYALLRNNRREAQLFEVEGWRAVSPRRMMDPVNGMWRIGDDGRFAVQALPGRVELRDPGSLAVRHTLPLASRTSLPKAWAAQPDGDLLALSAFDDYAVKLIDTRRFVVREMKPSPYAPVEWLAFSADGRWLTAAAGDRAFVWDVASGMGGVLPAGRGNASRVQADTDSGTVFVTYPPEAVLWQLPADTAGGGDLPTRIAIAQKLIAQVPIGVAAEGHAAAYAPAAHLAASIDVDGELRLWRWRRDALLAARAAPQIAASLYFDGRHVAAVDANRAQVVTVEDERAVSPAFVHPQPLGSAQLTADGRSLVTASGRELRVFDWRTGRLRFATIRLDESPLRVETDPQTRFLLVSIGGYRNGRFHELLSSYDLRNGNPLATDVAVPGPLAGLRFSPDGRHIVLWRYGELAVRDTASLRPSGKGLLLGPDSAAALRRVYGDSWRPDAASMADLTGTPVVDAALDAQARQLTVLTEGSQFADAQLLRFDLRSGERLSRRSLGKRQPIGLLAHGDTYESAMWTPTDPRWLDSNGSERPLPQMPADLFNAQAISRDGRWLASASEKGIVLADRTSGQWASAPLAVSLPMDDGIAQLAIAPDASGLLARSYYSQRWLWWPLPRETRPVAQLQYLLARLQSGTANGGQKPQSIAAAARAGLRGNDTRPLPAKPAPTASAALPDAIPRALAPPGYAFVDLAPATNHAIGAALLSHPDGTGNFATIPTGVQRYLGIDYDIRHLIALSMQNLVENPTISAPLAPPVPRFKSAHLLVGATSRQQDMKRYPHLPFGFLEIRYADGTHARVPIVYGRDMMQSWADAGDALPRRIAWVETGPQPYIFPGIARVRAYAARLENPHPQREVASIAFSTSDHAWSGPKILAVTLETGAAATADPVSAN